MLCAAAITLLAFRDGGFDRSTWWTATVAFLAVAGLAIVLGRATRPLRAQLWFLLGLGAFALWTALSALWSDDAATSLHEAERTVLYVAAVAAAVVVGGSLFAGTIAGIALVCAYAVGERLLRGPPDPPDPFEGTLLQEPIGYANALGGMAAIGFAAVVVLVPGFRPRPVAPALCVLFLVTLALTGSRGGWVAAIAGTAVALPLAWGRKQLAVAVAAACGLALALALALPAGSLVDEAAARGGDRAWYWHVAWQEVETAPVVGRGAGTFELAWLERQPVPVSVRDAHSLYLETLAELGVVGLALLLLAVAPPLVAALRSASAAALAGGYTAFLVHAGVDWDWELPVVTLAGLFLGAAALQRAPLQDLYGSDVFMHENHP